ncbi:MAG: hypothetical protein K2Z81_20045, partial [Cyanobacteria bacterium]|nr:hypothetical protein [Cyanobacteriota bacterium]
MQTSTRDFGPNRTACVRSLSGFEWRLSSNDSLTNLFGSAMPPDHRFTSLSISAQMECADTKEPFVVQMGRSALVSGVQQPLQGLAQLSDRLTGLELLPKLHFIEEPNPAEFGSSAWHAQTIGSSIGLVLPFLICRRAVFGVSRSAGKSLLSSRAAIGVSLKEAAVSGFVVDSLTKPVEEDEGFWQKRMMNGLGGAASFTALTAGNLSITKLASAPTMRTSLLGAALRNPAIGGFVSGVPAGACQSAVDAVKTGHISSTEVGRTIYSMMIAGGALGLKSQLFHQSGVPADGTTTLGQHMRAYWSGTTSACQSRRGSDAVISMLGEATVGGGGQSSPFAIVDRGREGKNVRPSGIERSSLDESAGTSDLTPLRAVQAELRRIFDPEKIASERVSTPAWLSAQPGRWGESFENWHSFYQDAYPVSERLLRFLQHENRTPSSRGKTIISADELNALQTLEHHCREQGSEMAAMLENRGPEALWILQKVRYAHSVYTPHEAVELSARARRFERARALWVGLTSQSEQALSEPLAVEASAVDSLATPVSASSVSELARSPDSSQGQATHPNGTGKPAHGARYNTATIEDARAIQLLAFENGLPRDPNEAAEAVLGRGPFVQALTRIIVNDSRLRQTLDFEPLSQKDFADFVERAKALESATLVETQLTSADRNTTGDTFSFQEAEAFVVSKTEGDTGTSRRLYATLTARGPVSSWVCEKLSRSVDDAYKNFSLSEVEYSELFERGSCHVRTARVLENVRSGVPLDSVPATFITAEEATALRSLTKESPPEGSKELDRLANHLSERGLEARILTRYFSYFSDSWGLVTEAELKATVETFEAAWKTLSAVRASNVTEGGSKRGFAEGTVIDSSSPVPSNRIDIASGVNDSLGNVVETSIQCKPEAVASESALPIVSYQEAAGYQQLVRHGFEQEADEIASAVSKRGRQAVRVLEQVKKQFHVIDESFHQKALANASRFDAAMRFVDRGMNESEKVPGNRDGAFITPEEARVYAELRS